MARTRSPRKNAGSARQEKVTSRAAPMPSNDDPVSRAAAAVKNRPSPNRYARRIRSPGKRDRCHVEPASGISNTATTAVTRPTTGRPETPRSSWC